MAQDKNKKEERQFLIYGILSGITMLGASYAVSKFIEYRKHKRAVQLNEVSLLRLDWSIVHSLNKEILHDLWDHYDKDGNGYLDAKEISELVSDVLKLISIKSAGKAAKFENAVTSTFETAHKNSKLAEKIVKDKNYAFAVIQDLFSDPSKHAEYSKQILQRVDTNKDGFISKNEVLIFIICSYYF